MINLEYIGGILFALAATVLFNLAPIVQKDALDRMGEISFARPVDSLKMMVRSGRWLFGVSLGILGAFPYIIALTWAGPAVVQPLISFGYIVLVLAARRILNERLSIPAWIAIFFMIVMPVFIYYSSVSNVDLDLSDPFAMVSLLIFAAVVLIFTAWCWFMSAQRPVFLAPVAGLLFSLGAISLTAMLAFITEAGYDLPGDAGAFITGVLHDRYCIYALSAGFLSIAFNVVGTFAVQVGLQKVAASTFTPINQTLNNMMTVMGGLTVFGQSVGNWGMYAAGMILAVAGTIILGRYRMSGEE